MAKVLTFTKGGKTAASPQVIAPQAQQSSPDLPDHEVEDQISAITNDHSLTPANRRWLLENLLMDIDDQLEEYKREMDLAEQKLEAQVQASEREIAVAYQEYIDRMATLTAAVKQLTGNGERRR